MAHELVYTSAERGLRPGSRGFCTVAYTQGMPPASIQMMEAISSYKSMYGAVEEQESLNPVSYSHYKSRLLGRDSSILSRVSPVQADHTGRSNKLAHHILIHKRERCVSGPLALCREEGFFVTEWEGAPRLIPMPKVLPSPPVDDGPASGWARITGDAGHAALLARSFLQDPGNPSFLVWKADMDILALLEEAARLLPAALRWDVTFNTYFTSLPAGMTCCWRCCLPEMEVLREVRRNHRWQIYDLTEPESLPEPPEKDPLVQQARNGGTVAAPEDVPDEKAHPPKRKFVLLPRRETNMLSLKPRKLE